MVEKEKKKKGGLFVFMTALFGQALQDILCLLIQLMISPAPI